MKNLRLFYSNRQEHLVQALAEELKTPLSSPLKPEIIVVQSKGMERWISMELARAHGVAANLKFPFPISLIYELFHGLLPDLPENSPFDQNTMTWQIMHLLPRLENRQELAPLNNYLRSPSGLKMVQLCRRLAFLFDQYLVFRPEMILDWDQGKSNHFSEPAQTHALWQALLWQKLAPERHDQHRAALKKELHRALNHKKNIDFLPERISLFGISSLPRYYLEILDHLAAHIQVNIFFLNPSPLFWGDLPSKREQSKIIKKGRHLQEIEEENSLLASWGELGRDFLDTIYSLELNPQEIDLFTEPERDTLLGRIQSDVFNLQSNTEQHLEPEPISGADLSLSIHSCHSPRREIEVLYDRLLGILENNPDLQPRDILVMTPDIDAYAPYIQAVFACPEADHKQLPFCIADQDLSWELQVSRIFLRIMDLSEGRLSVSEVLSVLESPLVYSKFNLGPSDLESIKNWIRDVRICWGENETSKEEEGLPAFKANTWQAGLERLLLGYSLSGRESKMFSAIVPYEHIEGSQVNVLENFLDFIQILFNSCHELRIPKPVSQWQRSLISILDSLLNVQASQESELSFLRQAVTNMASHAQQAGFEDKVEMQVIRYLLKQELREKSYGRGFLSGGITFCSMLPMRAIPFPVLCLVGMNDSSFPRQDQKPEFDLMAARPQKGDRSPRMDDRYLFLETLISARNYLHISYVGQNIKDNSAIPPSVVVSELADYVEENYCLQARNSIREHIVFKHPLQAFAPSYFQADAFLRSFSEDNLEAAQRLLAASSAEPFIPNSLSEPEFFQGEIDLKELEIFFKNPCQFLLEKRLSLKLRPSQEHLNQDVEPLWELDGLTNYQLGQELVSRIINSEDKHFYDLLYAQGELPQGVPGKIRYQQLWEEASSFARQVEELSLAEEKLASPNIDLNLKSWRLRGSLKNLYQSHLLYYRFAKLKAKDIFSAWLEHLILNALPISSLPQKSILMGKDKTYHFQPVLEAQSLLTEIFNYFDLGLKSPLPFFPQTSYEYASRIWQGKSRTQALEAAKKEFEGNRFKLGEGEDQHYQLCFKNQEPLGELFEQVAIDLFTPVLEHQN
jgi:exodeoxyribonuclease V gamma subunit